jgi:2-oxoglutarate dehydrogenase complex dehydrogenase (E1) component-like enzyme
MIRKVFLIIISSVFLCISNQLYAQVKSVVITGSVVDRQTNESLVGVTILLSGKQLRGLGTTDNKGNFKVTAPLCSDM